MKWSKDIENKKKSLIEKYGVFLEQQDHLSPIAARIISILVIDNKNALTFEEIVYFLKASKSTVSTNLKKLEEAGYIKYYTKPYNRKKYFQLSDSAYRIKVEEILKSYQKELNLINQVIDFKKETNQTLDATNNKYVIGNETYYADFLVDIIDFIGKFIKSN